MRHRGQESLLQIEHDLLVLSEAFAGERLLVCEQRCSQDAGKEMYLNGCMELLNTGLKAKMT